MNTEAVVYLARKFHWTRGEIGKLTPRQFVDIYNELAFQESVDIYREQYSVASLLAAIYNTIPRKRGSKVFKASDFLKGEMPQRNQKREPLDEMANKRGIQLPSKELKRRE